MNKNMAHIVKTNVWDKQVSITCNIHLKKYNLRGSFQNVCIIYRFTGNEDDNKFNVPPR